jgi:predicted nucleic acid-binding protein
MLRTQISLTEEERALLDTAAARTGQSISALIREAVGVVYGPPRSAEEDLSAMRHAFGSWSESETGGAEWGGADAPGHGPAVRSVSALVDTSVLIDYLRGHRGAAELLEAERAAAPLHASEITRLEVLAGMRAAEEERTGSLLSTLRWHEVDTEVTEQAGSLGRQWFASHHTIDSADLAIAATALRTRCGLLTRNVRHFPMFEGLRAAY